MRSKSTRAVAVATAAIMGLSAIAVTPAGAAPVRQKQMQSAQADTTDISARRRHRGNAAVVGAAAAIFGTIATIAAANAARDQYRSHYGYRPYYGGYAPYAYAPYGYEPYPYYSPQPW
jgi:hypothetical protein